MTRATQRRWDLLLAAIAGAVLDAGFFVLRIEPLLALVSFAVGATIVWLILGRISRDEQLERRTGRTMTDDKQSTIGLS